VQEGEQPDLTLYFVVDPATARSRASAIKRPDRFEQEREAFHAAVRTGYLRRAAEHRDRMRIIDSNGSVEDVRRQLDPIVAHLRTTVENRS
jgi:dTMP kinase